MKNLSICLFVLAVSVVGCDSKPPQKTAPPMPMPGAMGGHAAAHAGMIPPGGSTVLGEKKEDAAPAEKKEDDAAAPGTAPAEKKEGDAAPSAEAEKKE